MSTSSAHATALPSRRTLIAQAGVLASIGAAGASMAIPAFATEAGPIEAMWPEYLRLEAELDVAAMRAMDAEELYEEPDRPRWHPFHEEGGYLTITTRPGRGISVLDDGAQNIAYLKEIVAREHQPDDPDAGYSNAARAQRARQTLAKIDAWNAEVKRRKDAAGLTEADMAHQDRKLARRTHVDAIFATEATTFRELAFQAATLDVDWRQVDAERVLERLTVLAGITPYGLG